MICSFRQILFVFRLSYKADKYRSLFCFLYHLWVTFVNLVFLTLLPRWLIVAYEQKISWFRVLAVLLFLWISQIGYSLYSNYYNQIFKPVSDERIYHLIQKEIFFNSLSVPFSRLDEPEYYNDFMKAGREAKGRITSVMDQTFELILNFSALFILLYVMARIHIGFVLIALLAFFLPLLWKNRLNHLVFQGDMEALKQERKAEYVNRAFFLKQYSREIKISNISKVLLKQFSDAMRNLREIRRKYGFKIALLQMLSFFFHDILCYALFVLLAVFLLYHQSILLGDFVLAVTSLSVLTDRMNSCLNGFFLLRNAGNYLDNLEAFLPASFHNVPGQNQKITSYSHGCGHQEAEFSSLKLRGLTFRYNGCSQYSLKNISLTIHKGQHIALIGENGAGKSTLIKLLLGLYDAASGEILLNNRLLSDYDKNSYQSLFSCVFQDYAVFGCSIGENILCRKIEESDLPVLTDALEKSGLSEDMKRMNLTVHDIVTKEFDENGVIFSGGQLQKLAIARALAHDREILIMDEPSSALDPLAEQNMFRRLNALSKGKTLIYITHRISSAVTADMIYFLENGEITEHGSHQELMRLNGKYARLYYMQARSYKEN